MQCPFCGRQFLDGDCPVHGPAGALAAPAPDGPAPRVPGYAVTGILGHGGFGTVFAADGPDGRVAIKTAHRNQPVADARLRREAAALEAIGAPHVPRVHATGELADGTFYVVMELVTWPTLAERLARRPTLRLDEVLPIARGLLTALGAAHAHGLVHRDLKPENIFVADDGRVKLVDFGLVRRSGYPTEGLTLHGTVVGSTSYMSLEQSMGRDTIDTRSDIYAVGVLLYEMLAGRPPFVGPAPEVRQAHIARRPQRLVTLAAVPPGVDAIVHRCLAKSRDERPDTAAEVLAALERACAPAAPRTRRDVGLLFFRAAVDPTRVQRLVGGFAGSMAGAESGFAVVFDPDGGDHPERRALLAAGALVRQGIAERVVVDANTVLVLPRLDGRPRYVSLLFMSDDSFPGPDEPAGVLATARAAALLGDVRREPTARGRFLLVT